VTGSPASTALKLNCSLCISALLVEAAKLLTMNLELKNKKNKAMSYYSDKEGAQEVKLCGSSINFFYQEKTWRWKRFLCSKNGTRDDVIIDKNLINDKKCKDICSDIGGSEESCTTNTKYSRDKKYREWYYGGIEYQDDRHDPPLNPAWPERFSSTLDEIFFGIKSKEPAYYYMRGPAVKQGYHCDRFDKISCEYVSLASETTNPIKAGECYRILDAAERFKKECQAKESICVERGVDESLDTSQVDENGKYKFCNKGEECDLDERFSFTVYGSVAAKNHICAMTTSFCPYDYPLGGGTEDRGMTQSYLINTEKRDGFVYGYCNNKDINKNLNEKKCDTCYNIVSGKKTLSDIEQLQARMACVKCVDMYGVDPSELQLIIPVEKGIDQAKTLLHAEGGGVCSEVSDFTKLFTIENEINNEIISEINVQNKIEREIAQENYNIIIQSKKNETDLTNNFPQYLKHCVKKSLETQSGKFTGSSDIGFNAPESCTNMRGSTHNIPENKRYYYGYVKGTFSSPIVECFRDIMAEIFFNTASKSVCTNGASIQGVCDEYETKKGEKIKGESFFNTTQEIFGWFVKISLIFAVTFFGINILYGGGIPKKKDFMMFIAKVAFVTYFALGTGWKDIIYDGLYNFGHGFYDVIFDHLSEEDNDVCKFPRYSDGANKEVKSYPEGKEYLKIWDSLDCKLSLIFNIDLLTSAIDGALIYFTTFLDGASNTNFLSNILKASLQAVLFFKFTHSVLTLIIMLLLVSIIVKVAYVFISYSFMISMLIFISPITISCILFKKSEKVFTKWKDYIISFALQPLMLLIYTSLMLAVYDHYMIGDASFNINNTSKNLNYGYDYKLNEVIDCDGAQNSVYCDLDLDKDRTPSFIAGIKFFAAGSENVINLIKMAVIMFLLYGILDQVLNIAAKLTKGRSANTRSTFSIEEGYSKINSLESSVAKGTQTALESIRIKRDAGEDEGSNKRVAIAAGDEGSNKRVAIAAGDKGSNKRVAIAAGSGDSKETTKKGNGKVGSKLL
jgi:type IV secretory pathway VirB6-like protein